MRVDYSAFEGREVTGVPAIVLSRGRVIVDRGVFTGKPGHGRFVPRGVGTPIPPPACGGGR